MERVAWTSAFALACLVLLGGMTVGYAVVHWVSNLPAERVEVPQDLLDGVEMTPQTRKDLSVAAGPSADLFIFILGRNFSVYVWLLAGLLSAGAITFAVLLFNGISLGQTIGFAVWSGLPPGVIVDLVAPHGVLEMGTFCIGGAVGFQGLRVVRRGAQSGWAVLKTLRLGLVLAFGAVALAVAAGVEALVVADSMALLEDLRGEHRHVVE